MTRTTCAFIGLLAISALAAVSDAPLAISVPAGLWLLLGHPGVQALRCFRSRLADTTEAALYSLGIAVLVAMSVGLTVNYIAPLTGARAPLTTHILVPCLPRRALLSCCSRAAAGITTPVSGSRRRFGSVSYSSPGS